MAFKSFTPESLDDMLDSLPWADKWKQRNKEDETSRRVMACQVYASGIMVITADYKGYVHEGTKLHDHLKEALDVWTAERKQLPSLFCKCHKKGRLELGTDEEVLNNYWLKTENRYVQVAKGDKEEEEEPVQSNPLLGGSGVQAKTGARKRGS